MKIEFQRPHAPEQVDVAFPHATATKVDKAAESPAVKQNVGQAVIPVKQGIPLQLRSKLPDDGNGFFTIGAAVIAAAAVKKTVSIILQDGIQILTGVIL